MSHPALFIIAPNARKTQALEAFYGIGGSQHEREHGLTTQYTSDGENQTHWGSYFGRQNQNGPRIAQLRTGEFDAVPGDIDADLITEALTNYVVYEADDDISSVDLSKINIFIGRSSAEVLLAVGLEKYQQE